MLQNSSLEFFGLFSIQSNDTNMALSLFYYYDICLLVDEYDVCEQVENPIQVLVLRAVSFT